VTTNSGTTTTFDLEGTYYTTIGNTTTFDLEATYETTTYEETTTWDPEETPYVTTEPEVPVSLRKQNPYADNENTGDKNFDFLSDEVDIFLRDNGGPALAFCKLKWHVQLNTNLGGNPLFNGQNELVKNDCVYCAASASIRPIVNGQGINPGLEGNLAQMLFLAMDQFNRAPNHVDGSSSLVTCHTVSAVKAGTAQAPVAKVFAEGAMGQNIASWKGFNIRVIQFCFPSPFETVLKVVSQVSFSNHDKNAFLNALNAAITPEILMMRNQLNIAGLHLDVEQLPNFPRASVVRHQTVAAHLLEKTADGFACDAYAAANDWEDEYGNSVNNEILPAPIEPEPSISA
jgi:hypothetical protein